jgi:hypothetical protein
MKADEMQLHDQFWGQVVPASWEIGRFPRDKS